MKRNLWYLTGLVVVLAACSSPVDPQAMIRDSISGQTQLPVSDQPDLQRPTPHGKPGTQDTLPVAR